MIDSINTGKPVLSPYYVYTYTCQEDEVELCALELYTLLGTKVQGGAVRCSVPLDVDRSPYVKRRIEVQYAAEELSELTLMLNEAVLGELTFKVLSTPGDEKFTYEEHRRLERAVGAAMRGRAEMLKPDLSFGLIRLEGRWHFGPCTDNSALWLHHQNKPQNYSTALPTRLARAMVNIAAGREPLDKRLLDPCCGMGTVLVEAMSMGMNIEGFDRNPLAVKGARTNLRHFGFPERVAIADMTTLEGEYDVLLLDMPYNLCSVLSEHEQLMLLESARRLARRAVIVTTVKVEQPLGLAGWTVHANATVRKGSFTRYVTVVE